MLRKPPVPRPTGDCAICYEGAASVLFDPCQHFACTACVRKMRQANIFKPDAGVVCPFCREPIAAYIPRTDDADIGPPPRPGGEAGSLR
eukprot:4262629-Pyramimonas_sp.AAC.1